MACEVNDKEINSHCAELLVRPNMFWTSGCSDASYISRTTQ